MAGPRVRRTAGGAAVLAVALSLALSGCADDDGDSPAEPSDAASRAASAAASLASEASEVLASATAEAGRRIEEITEGIDVRDDVRLGTPRTDGAGRATVEVTARNTAASARSFVVQIDFTDRDGNLRDTVVVTVSGVPAGQSGRATARSTHALSGDVRAEVARAVRY
ncbi:hypothetical protein ACF06Q_13285 [Streptomyces leeuwenhoekii]|jgi:hypothetical protein|uniref:hypothetical protein n=1 Tax=Streptomyces leeuwenhoekii TaxID=1437453 RepID=UPI0036FB2A77